MVYMTGAPLPSLPTHFEKLVEVLRLQTELNIVSRKCFSMDFFDETDPFMGTLAISNSLVNIGITAYNK